VELWPIDTRWGPISNVSPTLRDAPSSSASSPKKHRHPGDVWRTFLRVFQRGTKGGSMSLIVILLLVVIVLALLGYFGRGFRRV
jgi:hypothetical protein